MSNKIHHQPSCADPFEPGMISMSEALARIQKRVIPVLACERLPIRECLNRVNNEAVKSPRKVPPLPNSAMDGYALAIGSLIEGSIAEFEEIGTDFVGLLLKRRLKLSFNLHSRMNIFRACKFSAILPLLFRKFGLTFRNLCL